MMSIGSFRLKTWWKDISQQLGPQVSSSASLLSLPSLYLLFSLTSSDTHIKHTKHTQESQACCYHAGWERRSHVCVLRCDEQITALMKALNCFYLLCLFLAYITTLSTPEAWYKLSCHDCWQQCLLSLWCCVTDVLLNCTLHFQVSEYKSLHNSIMLSLLMFHQSILYALLGLSHVIHLYLSVFWSSINSGIFFFPTWSSKEVINLCFNPSPDPSRQT